MGAAGEVRDMLCGSFRFADTSRAGFSCSSQLVAAWQHRRSEAFHTRSGHAPVWGSALRGRPRSGTRTSRVGRLWFCHVELQFKKMEPETRWAAVKIQVGRDTTLSWERWRQGNETVSKEATRPVARMDVGGEQWDGKGGSWFLAEAPDRWDRAGEVTDRTVSGQGNLVGLALSVSEAQTRLLVSESSFNLGLAEKACLLQGPVRGAGEGCVSSGETEVPEYLGYSGVFKRGKKMLSG